MLCGRPQESWNCSFRDARGLQSPGRVTHLEAVSPIIPLVMGAGDLPTVLLEEEPGLDSACQDSALGTCLATLPALASTALHTAPVVQWPKQEAALRASEKGEQGGPRGSHKDQLKNSSPLHVRGAHGAKF